MSALSAHRSLGGRLRSELYRNVCLLSLRKPMLQELGLMLNGGPQTLDKLNQALLIHLSYYLATIIDPKLSVITWPLYDRASERTYKTQLLGFVSMFYYKAGSTEKDKWITPIQPSYLNAGGFKVMQLLFEMSQLALSKLIRAEFKLTNEQLEACDLLNFTKQKEKIEMFNARAKEQLVEKSVKFLIYKKKALELSESYKRSIFDLEKENEALKKTLDRCVDVFAKSDVNNLVQDLKNVNTPSTFLSDWSDAGDQAISSLEAEWAEKMQRLTHSATNCCELSELTVARSTLNDKSAYTIEYCPKTDKIDTEKLEMEVSSQQRYILKNIVKNDTLNFPNLLRGYVVAICYLFKDVRCVEPMDVFNHHLACFGESYDELLVKARWLLDEMHRLDLKLQKGVLQPSFVDEDFDSIEMVIPPLPDLRFRDEPWQHQCTKGFTPLLTSKVQFSIRNYVTSEATQPRSLFQIPQTISRPAIFKNIAKPRADESMISNISKVSQTPKEMNKTTAECTTGFSQQQLNRLLSSRKSSTKKTRPAQNTESHSKVRRSNLFRDTPENSFTVVRSLSSPNLNCVPTEAKRTFSVQNQRIRHLYAIAQEESPDKPLEVSGIGRLQSSKNSTPQNTSLLNGHADFKSMPAITVSKPDAPPEKSYPTNCNSPLHNGVASIVDNFLDQPVDDKEPVILQPELKTPPVSRNAPVEVKKANSIEKLIEKYKKIRHNTSKMAERFSIFPSLSPITDLQQPEKEHEMNEISIDTPFLARLPDLVSPNGIGISNKAPSNVPDWLIQDTPLPKTKNKCRESLGTALGVDHSFLDQFDLLE